MRSSRITLIEAQGSYVNGVWVPGTRSVGSIMASIQPVVMGQDMASLPEGRRISDFVKIYTGTNLKVTDDGDGIQPDFVAYDGHCYELVSRYANQNAIISHYKYIAVRQMKFTNSSDWLSGAIVRP